MICYYRTTDDRLEQINLPEEGCWVSVTAPCEAELEQLSREFAIELDDIKAPLDDDERARIQVEDSYTMILVDMPVIEKRAEGDWYGTMPLSIIITDKMIFTVCLEESPVITHFLSMKQRSFHTRMKTRFILQILYKNSSLYLQYLRSINRISEGVEKMLRHSTKNEELIKLLDLEKSLVYFTTSLRSNELVLEKLMKIDAVKKYPEDTDLLEDVIVENKQAIEMANIYSGILSGMMDAFASVISNNLNIVMKFLAVMTIVLSVPTMIFSAYGMNVAENGMPFATLTGGFWIVVAISVVLSLVVALIFAKRKMF